MRLSGEMDAVTGKALEPERTRRIPMGRTLICCLALLLAAHAIMYRYIAFAPDTARFMGAGDAHTEEGPNMFFLDQRLHEGEAPLWNPLMLCGTPFAAHPLRFVFYPPNILRSLLTFGPTPFKTHIGIALMVLAHLLLAGCGTYALARRQGMSKPAAFTAAFGFIFSAGFVYRAVGHYGFNLIVAWVPLLLLLTQHAFEAESLRKRFALGLGGGLLFAQLLLAGAPQIVALSAFFVVMHALFLRLLASGRPPGAPLAAKLRGDAVFLITMVAVGILLACPLYLPLFEFARYSARAGAAGGLVRIVEPENPAWNLVQLLVTYSGSKALEGFKGAGLGVLLLAIAAAFHPRRRAAGLYAVLFLIMLDCSFGSRYLFGRLVDAFVPFDMSNPPRAMILACLPLGMLAGFGVDALTQPPRSTRGRMVRTCILAAMGLVLLTILVRCVSPHPWLKPGWWVVLFPGALVLTALAAIWVRRPLLWGCLLAALVFAEQAAWNASLVPWYFARGNLYDQPLEALKHERAFWQDNTRDVHEDINAFMYDLEPAINGYDPLHIARVRAVLCAEPWRKKYRRFVDHKEPTEGSFYGNLFLKRPFWLARQYVRGPLRPRYDLFPPATTIFLPEDTKDLPVPWIREDSLPHSAVSDAARRIDIAESALEITPGEGGQGGQGGQGVRTIHIGPAPLPGRHAALIIAFRSTGPISTHTRLSEPSTGRQSFGKTMHFDAPHGQAFLWETPLPDFGELEAVIDVSSEKEGARFELVEAYILADEADENALIAIKERSANAVDLKLTGLPGPRLLLFADAAFPGWRAYVDGVPVDILRANDAFKAIAVPGGDHAVRFEFCPRMVYLGMAIGLAALAFVAGALAWLWKQSRG